MKPGRIFIWVKKHKVATVLIAAVVLGVVYTGYKKIAGNNGVVQYAVAEVQKGTVVVSVSGSGQVSASNQLDLKPKVSGDVVFLGVKEGQEVKSGNLLVQLDAQDAQKAVRDAQANLENAQLALDKLTQPADKLSLIQAENSLARAQDSKVSATDDLKKAYDDGFNAVANVFLDLPNIMGGLYNLLYSMDRNLGGNSGQWNIDYYSGVIGQYDQGRAQVFRDDVNNKFKNAKDKYDANFDKYKSLSRLSSTDDIEGLINQTYETTRAVAEAIKSANSIIQFYKDKLTENNFKPSPVADTHLATLNTYTGQTNLFLSNVLGVQNTIRSDKDAITNAERTIIEQTESLNKLKNGPDELDVKSAELSVQQRENALLDAKEKLEDYYIRAPFDGTVAKLNVKKSDSVSGGFAVATLVTKQELAEVSLNEVDVSKVKVGQKATLTFDAIPELSMTGEVAGIDTVGTVSQGVVTYNVKINLDTQDAGVKSGMSVTAAIITDVKQDVLEVPNAAVKLQGEGHYVEVVNKNALNFSGVGSTSSPIVSGVIPNRVTVGVGLSNDTMTEITGGLNEGDLVVTRTISSNSNQTQQQQNSNLRIPGLGGGGFRN